MKYRMLFIVLGSWPLVAMDQISNNNNNNDKDEVIEMGEVKKKYKKPNYFKTRYAHKRSNSFDGELQGMEYHDGYYNLCHLDKEQYVHNFLSELPIFKGKKEEKIIDRMKQIESILPKEYGEITESLSISYRGFKKRAGLNRGISDIDRRDVNDINSRIQYALLEIADENQKIATKNREEDLEQAGRDRKRSIIISCVSLLLSIPAIILAGFNIDKALHS